MTKRARIGISRASRNNSCNPPAPLPLHSPVNELHSIEIQALTNLFFLLTKKIEGVKHNCSLTVSEVFPVGAASGGQATSPSAEGKSGAQEDWATNTSSVQLLQDNRRSPNTPLHASD